MKVAPDESRKAALPAAPGDAGPPPDCDCVGAGPPPPHFQLPPPPPPPPLRCTQLPPADAEHFCDVPPVFQEAEPWGEAALPSAAAIALGCVLLLLAAAASASVMLWKYRRKVGVGVRCSSPRHSHPRSEASSAGDSSALYEDAASLRPRSLVLRCGATVQTPQGTKHRRGCPAVAGRPVFVCADPYAPHDVCTPVYQEIAPGSPSDPEDHIYAVPVLQGRVGGRSPPEELAVGELSDRRPRHQQQQQHQHHQQQQQQGDVALLEALMQRYSGAFSSHGPGCVGAPHPAVK